MTNALWAPWRMEYLFGDKPTTCFLCEGSKDPATFREHLVLVAQPHAYVLLNRFPFTTSHLLVAPRRHIGDLAELEPDEYTAVMSLLRESTIRLRQGVHCQGMNVGFNLGKTAGAGVPGHVHGHIVPRWDGDTNFMPVLADVRVMPEYLDASWRRLYDAFLDVPGTRAPAPGPA
jgi:ATP adenylyltransferase